GGQDNVSAGAGTDRLVVDYSAAPGNFSGGPSSGDFASGYGGVYSNSVDTTVSYSGVEHFTITTAGGDDNITTGDGDDVVNTAAGNSSLPVEGGQDNVTAGAGTDRLTFDYSGASGNISGGPSSGDLAGGYGGTYTNSVDTTVSFSGVEHFTITTAAGNDNI